MSPTSYGTLAVLALALALAYRSTFASLAREWAASETYSHGFLVPWIALALAWMRRDRIRSVVRSPSILWGSALVLAGIGMKIAGFAADATVVEGTSLLPLLAGLVALYGGIGLLRVLLLPLLYLLFMIPVWAPILDWLTPSFRHFSAGMGVGLARALGVPAALDGFVIRLPATSLYVAEACSGINYLVAVTAVGIPLAWVSFPDARRRVALLMIGAAIAILANGLRVTLIIVLLHGGLIHDVHGPGHMLQGLSVALVGYGGLFVTAWILSRTGPRRPARGPAAADVDTPRELRPPGHAWIVAAAAIAVALGALAAWQSRFRIDPVPLPRPLTSLPTRIGEWRGTEGALPAIAVPEIPDSDRLERTYGSLSGGRASILVLYVPEQSGPRELIGYKTAPLLKEGSTVPVRTAHGLVKVRRSERSDGRRVMVTYAWYQINGQAIASAWQAKAKTAWNTLTRRRSNAAVIAVRGYLRPEEATGHEPGLLSLVAGVRDGLRASLP